jgi:hypothetical protein
MARRIICEGSELAVECAHLAQEFGVSVDPQIAEDWFREAVDRLSAKESVALALLKSPSLDQIVEISHLARSKRSQVVLATVEGGDHTTRVNRAAGDMGVTAMSEMRALIAAVALLDAEVKSPWTASVRTLPTPDRSRVRKAMTTGGRSQGQLTREKGGVIAWSADSKSPKIALGEARDVATAITALRDTDRTTPNVEFSVEDVDEQAVLDVIFGPPRALSDPASKAALAHYGLAMPVEELCASASRTAAEANRIGYPVRVALASPDLRVWDHPDLAVDAIDNAARVREVFGLLTGLAKKRTPDARLLGVTVAAANEAVALLGVRATPLPLGRVAVKVSFADPHGKSADDAVLLVLPAPMTSIERALTRLRGRELILPGNRARTRSNLDAIGDTLMRVAVFVNELRDEIDAVELLPLALLTGGGVEVREACITVNDAFERIIAGVGDREPLALGH